MVQRLSEVLEFSLISLLFKAEPGGALSTIPALGRQKQKYPECKVSLSYRVTLRPACSTCDPLGASMAARAFDLNIWEVEIGGSL